MENKLNVTLSGDNEKPVITVLEGNYQQPKEPVKIILTGNIESISNFLSQRYITGKEGYSLQKVDMTKAVAVVDEAKMNINLHLDPENHYGTTITANLELSDELKLFKVNTGTMWNRSDIIKLLRFNRRYFPDQEKYMALIESFQKLNLQVNSNLVNESDSRGTKDLQFKKFVTNQLPAGFTLDLPIFKGQENRRFFVELCLDVVDQKADFWFESPELDEFINADRKKIFAKQLESCKDFPIIYK
jgi:hypothetical protein